MVLVAHVVSWVLVLRSMLALFGTPGAGGKSIQCRCNARVLGDETDERDQNDGKEHEREVGVLGAKERKRGVGVLGAIRRHNDVARFGCVRIVCTAGEWQRLRSYVGG
jgi:hypothetical protein